MNDSRLAGLEPAVAGSDKFTGWPCDTLTPGTAELGPWSAPAEFLFGGAVDGESGGVFNELKNALRAACLWAVKSAFSLLSGLALTAAGGNIVSPYVATAGFNASPILTESALYKGKSEGLLMFALLDSTLDLSVPTLVDLGLKSGVLVELLSKPSCLLKTECETGKTGLTEPLTW